MPDPTLCGNGLPCDCRVTPPKGRKCKKCKGTGWKPKPPARIIKETIKAAKGDP